MKNMLNIFSAISLPLLLTPSISNANVYLYKYLPSTLISANPLTYKNEITEIYKINITNNDVLAAKSISNPIGSYISSYGGDYALFPNYDIYKFTINTLTVKISEKSANISDALNSKTTWSETISLGQNSNSIKAGISLPFSYVSQPGTYALTIYSSMNGITATMNNCECTQFIPQIMVSNVPEPETYLLSAMGIAGILTRRIKRKKYHS